MLIEVKKLCISFTEQYKTYLLLDGYLVRYSPELKGILVVLTAWHFMNMLVVGEMNVKVLWSHTEIGGSNVPRLVASYFMMPEPMNTSLTEHRTRDAIINCHM